MPDRVDEIADAIAARYPDHPPMNDSLRNAVRNYIAALEGRPITEEKAKRLTRLWNGGSR